jgi:hypothetical protein
MLNLVQHDNVKDLFVTLSGLGPLYEIIGRRVVEGYKNQIPN